MTVNTLHPARLWQQHPREIAALAGVAVASLVLAAGAASSSPGMSGFTRDEATAATPAAPPLLVRDVAPEEALALNGKIPLATGPNPAALPFSTAGLSPAARASALECLSSAVYYEAGRESDEGQRAVAQVVLNRVRHPAFPSTVCGVVYQGSTRSTGCQFTFTCDGSLQRRPDSEGWARASRVAQAALNGSVYAPAGWATHYHANYVLPYWASSLVKNAVVGAHLFYRWSGGWGRPPAFAQRYAKLEPSSLALRTTALTAFANRAAVAPAPMSAAAVEAEAEKAVEEIPGAKIQTALPGRVAIRFDLAKAAVEKAAHKPYVEKVAASDNLRWTLSDGAPSTEAPLGKAPAAPSGSASSN